jgi:nitronate monooxygenase
MVAATERDTVLVGRSYGDSARVLRNTVSAAAVEREKQGGATYKDLAPLIGAPAWMKAMEEGAIDGGAIPVGLVIGVINDIPSCAELIARIVAEARTLVRDRLRGAVGS